MHERGKELKELSQHCTGSCGRSGGDEKMRLRMQVAGCEERVKEFNKQCQTR